MTNKELIYNVERINRVVAKIVRISHYGLYFGSSRLKAHAKLFELTKLDFEYLKRRFEKEYNISSKIGEYKNDL